MLTDKEISEQIKKQTLDRIPFTFGVQYPTTWLNNVTVEQFIDVASEHLAIQINFAIPGIQRQIREGYWPATWWDALKDRSAPGWFKRRYPVKYEKIKLTTINELHPMAL